MPQAKPGQLQQATTILLEAPLQRPDSHMLGESTLSVPWISPCSGACQAFKSCSCCLLPWCLVSWTSRLLKSSLQKGLALRMMSSWCLSAVKDLSDLSIRDSPLLSNSGLSGPRYEIPLALCPSPQLSCETLLVEPCPISDSVVPWCPGSFLQPSPLWAPTTTGLTGGGSCSLVATGAGVWPSVSGLLCFLWDLLWHTVQARGPPLEASLG